MQDVGAVGVMGARESDGFPEVAGTPIPEGRAVVYIRWARARENIPGRGHSTGKGREE